jgi:hypothetical protein
VYVFYISNILLILIAYESLFFKFTHDNSYSPKRIQ